MEGFCWLLTQTSSPTLLLYLSRKKLDYSREEWFQADVACVPYYTSSQAQS